MEFNINKSFCFSIYRSINIFFNIFYIQIAQVDFVFALQFNDSVNNSFESTSDNVDSSEALNNNIIITDIILIINKQELQQLINMLITLSILLKNRFNSDLIEYFQIILELITKTVFVEKEEVVKETIEETETEEITKDNNQNVALKEKSL